MHAFGYSKAECFSSGVEGALILLASASIAWTAVPRLVTPRPLEQVGIGLAVSVVAALLNFAVARRLLQNCLAFVWLTIALICDTRRAARLTGVLGSG